MSLSHDIAIVVVWIESDCLEINKANVHSNKVNYWWKYESRNSSPWRYKFKTSRYKSNIHSRSVFCSTRIPWEITKAETLSLKDSGFLFGNFLGDSGWTEYLTRCFLPLSSVINLPEAPPKQYHFWHQRCCINITMSRLSLSMKPKQHYSTHSDLKMSRRI